MLNNYERGAQEMMVMEEDEEEDEDGDEMKAPLTSLMFSRDWQHSDCRYEHLQICRMYLIKILF